MFKNFNLEQLQETRNLVVDPSRQKLLELKRMLNFVLQNETNRDIASNYYDIQNYEEGETDQLPTLAETIANAMPLSAGIESQQ